MKIVVLGVIGPEVVMDFSSKEVERGGGGGGGGGGTVHGQPTYYL